jgi:hypothetical protein
MNRRHYRIITAYGLVVLPVLLLAAAQPHLAGAVPAEWAMIPGWNVFVEKGCGTCHPVYRKGGSIANDLAIDNVVSTPAGQGAAMRNHGRYMATRARRQPRTPTPLLPPRPDRYAATVRSGTGPPVEGSWDG